MGRLGGGYLQHKTDFKGARSSVCVKLHFLLSVNIHSVWYASFLGCMTYYRAVTIVIGWHTWFICPVDISTLLLVSYIVV